MQWFEALILGAIEGVTEFLPISSTAHLMLGAELLGLAQTELVKTFEIAIQLGAILAVVVLYWRAFLDIETIKRLGVAFLPTGMVAFFFYPFIKSFLIGNVEVALVMLFLGGAALIAFELWYKAALRQNEAQMTYGRAFVVGLFQSVSVIPGVSRSAATILGGLLLGLPRTVIVEFSFLLAVPTMAAATGYDLLQSAGHFGTEDLLPLLLGFVMSFAVAMGAITFLLRFIRRHDFIPFGIYRMVAAAVFFLVFL